MSKIIFKYFTVTAFLVFFLPLLVSAQVVISEVMYNPDGLDSGREWIEIKNISSQDIDIASWKFRENSINHSINLISGASVLSPGQFAVIADNADVFLADNPSFSGNLFDSSFSLSNSGERLSILNDTLKEVDYVNYFDDWGASGTDETLQFESNFEGWTVYFPPTPGADYIYEGEGAPYLFAGKILSFDPSKNPHVIKAQIKVSNNLEFFPGSEIRFKKGAALITEENKPVSIIGTKVEPIVFKSDELAPIKGDYVGLEILNGVVADIQYVNFNHAEVAINFSGSKLNIKNSKFLNNKTGIDLSNLRSADIQNSNFENNDIGLLHRAGIVPMFAIQNLDFQEVNETTSNIFIRNSVFENNVLYGVKNEDENGLSLIDARNNFWGNETGPRHINNLSGVGDKVSDYVLFEPYLLTRPQEGPTCVLNCFSSVLFIPGLEASRLYKPDYNGGTDTLWEPNRNEDVEQLFLDEYGNSIRYDVYTKDVIEEIFGFLGNIYKTFLAELAKWKNEEGLIDNYAVIPYDWRLTIDDILNYGNVIEDRIYYSGDLKATSTPFLISKLRQLAESSRNGKVSIVAHSNGGLVAKLLLKRLADTNDPLLTKIDNLFLVAVPQFGTPEAIGALLHGFEQAHFPVINGKTARELGKNMPSAYQLLPSGYYFSSFGQSVLTSPIEFGSVGFSQIDDAVKTYGNSISDKNELWGFLAGGGGRSDAEKTDLASPAILNSQLLSYADRIHAEIDSWTPPSSLNVHQIAGWGEGTLGSITYRKKDKCVSFVTIDGNLYCSGYEPTWTYKPNMVVDGDGVVVVPSALAMSTSSPNVKRWWVDLKSYNTFKIKDIRFEREHKNILEIPELINLIRGGIIGFIDLPDFVFSDSPVGEESDQTLNFYLHSPLDLSVVDSSGHKLSSTTSEIKGARYKKMGEVQYVSVPKDVNPAILLIGQSDGSFDLEIEEVVGGIVTATTSFSSIPSSPLTYARIVFGGSGSIEESSDLQIDYDGNGSVDLNLKPKIGENVAPPELDIEAPEIRFVFSTTTNNLKIEGIDNSTKYPKEEISNSVIKISDDFSNFLSVRFWKKRKSNSELFFDIGKLTYSTTTVSVYDNGLTMGRYHVVFNQKKKEYASFSSYLFTKDSNVLAIYNRVKNQTKIFILPQNIYDIGLSTIEQKMPKNVIIKETLNGLVIPYFETQKGKIIIKY